MTVLSASTRNPALTTVQCDLCSLPLIVTNLEPVIAGLGWQLTSRGAAFDACPACLEARDGRSFLSLRREGLPVTHPEGRLPNLVVIGAAKAGTTSMHAYLDAHPDVSMAALKELRFFTDPHHEAWLDAYRRQFDPTAAVAGESSTMYTRAPALPGVVDRMAGLIPDAKLIYMVRDPVDRAVASYVEERFHGLESRPVEEAFADVEDPYNPYVAASRYAEQLSPFLARFPSEQVLVLGMGDLGRDPAATLRRTFAFLGVDPDVAVDTSTRHNDRGAKIEYGGAAGALRRSWAGRVVRRMPPGLKQRVSAPARRMLTRPITAELSPATAERLRAALRPDAVRFRELTGLEFADWSV